MKLEISGSESVREPIIRLALVARSEGITVAVVDEYGERVKQGSLVTFRYDGTIFLHSNIDEAIGFELDTHGQQFISS